MEALAKTRIAGEVRQVLDFIFRKTYGFNKIEDKISLFQFCSGTGLRKPNVSRAIRKLVDDSVIIKIDNADGISKFKINKDYEEWKCFVVINTDNAVINTDKAKPLSKPIKSVINTDKKIINTDNKSLSKLINYNNNITKVDNKVDNKSRDDTPSQNARKFFDEFQEGNVEWVNRIGDNWLARAKTLTPSQKEAMMEEIRKFVFYWTEPNKSGTKVRWELEKVFDVSRRLITWLSRSREFSNFNKMRVSKKGFSLDK